MQTIAVSEAGKKGEYWVAPSGLDGYLRCGHLVEVGIKPDAIFCRKGFSGCEEIITREEGLTHINNGTYPDEAKIGIIDKYLRNPNFLGSHEWKAVDPELNMSHIIGVYGIKGAPAIVDGSVVKIGIDISDFRSDRRSLTLTPYLAAAHPEQRRNEEGETDLELSLSPTFSSLTNVSLATILWVEILKKRDVRT